MCMVLSKSEIWQRRRSLFTTSFSFGKCLLHGHNMNNLRQWSASVDYARLGVTDNDWSVSPNLYFYPHWHWRSSDLHNDLQFNTLRPLLATAGQYKQGRFWHLNVAHTSYRPISNDRLVKHDQLGNTWKKAGVAFAWSQWSKPQTENTQSDILEKNRNRDLQNQIGPIINDVQYAGCWLAIT
jgi:hypothetical protein